MKLNHIILSIAALAAYSNAKASSFEVERLLAEPTPTYLKTTFESPGWNGNWFVGVQAGGNAFIGSPLGCDDLGGRIMPMYGVYFGKWFTPSVGIRVSFSGYQFKNGALEQQTFIGGFLECLYNINPCNRFSLIPYLGTGLLHNHSSSTNPFAISYGVIAQYALSSRCSLNIEFSGNSTFADFDGLGAANKFGRDNMLALSAGFSITIGRTGFKKVVDARPFWADNSRLRELCRELYEKNRLLSNRSENDARVIAELKKIFEIEGLLSQYDNLFKLEYGDTYGYPINDYSGLNSLRDRMKGNGNNCYRMKSASTDTMNTDGNETIESICWARDGEGVCVGSPILFFFKLGTAELTDASQFVNLDEMARVINQYNLRVRITGAADSSTGNDIINKQLGNDRSEFIFNALIVREVDASIIIKNNDGGINSYNPTEANRHCKVELLLPLQKQAE